MQNNLFTGHTKERDDLRFLRNSEPYREVWECKHFTPEIVRKNPDLLFVFGDNLEGVGRKGQSIIRGGNNTFGIPTKVTAYRYMDDSEMNMNYVLNAFEMLKLDIRRKNMTGIVVPTNCWGSGLAKLKYHAPKIMEYIENMHDIMRGRLNK